MKTTFFIALIISIIAILSGIAGIKQIVTTHFGISIDTLENILWLAIVLITLLALPASRYFYCNVPEGKVGVVTRFKKFTKVLKPGFNLAPPWESIRILSVQTRAIELEFQAITRDQASVHFNCTILFSVEGTDKEMIRKAAYAFATPEEFELSVKRLLEDETRAYVAPSARQR